MLICTMTFCYLPESMQCIAKYKKTENLQIIQLGQDTPKHLIQGSSLTVNCQKQKNKLSKK